MSIGIEEFLVLKQSDSILQMGWAGCSTTAEVMFNACGSTSTWGPNELISILGESDVNAKIRAEVGRELQTYAGGAWVPATPRTDYGPMPITKIEVVEDPEAYKGWKIVITSEGMGRIHTKNASDEDSSYGQPLIRMNIQNRSRIARAWRVEGALGNTDPALSYITDAISHGKFTRGVWHTGTDIGGQKVDINTQPIPFKVEQKQINIDIVRRGEYLSWTTTSAGNPAYSNAHIDDLKKFPSAYLDPLPPSGNTEPDGAYKVGGRNLTALLGFGVGEVMLDNVTVSTLKEIGNFKMISYSFVVEPNWKHADQMPLVIPNVGTWAATTQDTTTGMAQSNTVFWNQTHFGGWDTVEADWPAEEWDYLEAMST